MGQASFPISIRNRLPAVLLPTVLLLLAVVLAAAAFWHGATGAEPARNQCVACHGDASVQAQSRKLANYFRDWDRSIHRQAEVTCVDCHGGDATQRTKAAAHQGAALRSRDAGGALGHRNIPNLCAECHQDIYRQFRESAHYRALVKGHADQRAPNCVTCHGSVNTFVLNVNTVRQACAECHGPGDANAEVPEQAERLLSTLLAIWRYAGYLGQAAGPNASKTNLPSLDQRVRELNRAWHTFEIDAVEERAELLLVEVQEQARRSMQAQDAGRRRARRISQ